jgi:hypothetical protein
VGTSGHAVTIHLVPMTKSRLGDALATLNLQNQTMSIGNKIIVYINDVSGHHGTEK